MKAASLLLVAASFAVLAWSASQPPAAVQPTGRWENASELKWLTHFGHWQTALYDRRISFGRCGRSLALRVGSPPTARLTSGFRLARSVCGAPDIGVGLPSLYDAIAVLGRGQRKPLARARGIPDVRVASYTDIALTQIATEIAGKPVQALCWSPQDWRRLAAEEGALWADPIAIDDLGWATLGGSRINLSPGTCESFEEIVSRDDSELRRDPYYWGWAFTTVTHEAEHARGTDNEAKTECFAIQEIAEAAFDFGYAHATGRMLARAVWAHYGSELPAYRSDRCRNGGPYDLHPDASTWP